MFEGGQNHPIHLKHSTYTIVDEESKQVHEISWSIFPVSSKEFGFEGVEKESIVMWEKVREALDTCDTMS